jgi:hypothetical protein
MNKNYDIVFLEFGVPLETRYKTSGQLVNLVYYLNKFGIKSAIAILPESFNLLYRVNSPNYIKIKDSIYRFLTLNTITSKLMKKLFLHYSKEDYINTNIIKIKNLKKIEKLNPRFVSAWSWESAYLLNKTNLNNSIKKLQILHYKWEPEFLMDYFPEEYLPMFREAYFSDMIKIAISRTQLDDFKNVKIYHWLQGINTHKFFLQKR